MYAIRSYYGVRRTGRTPSGRARAEDGGADPDDGRAFLDGQLQREDLIVLTVVAELRNNFV